jgi:hypothetical protein
VNLSGWGVLAVHRPQRVIITRWVNKGGVGHSLGRTDVNMLVGFSFTVDVQRALPLYWHEGQDKSIPEEGKCLGSNIDAGSLQVMEEKISGSP